MLVISYRLLFEPETENLSAVARGFRILGGLIRRSGNVSLREQAAKR
jgi:hypothetical protein